MTDAYVVVDLEMTGLNPKTDRILEIGAVKVQGGKITDTFQRMVNPQMALPKEIVALTGITDEMAKNGCDSAHAVKEFVAFAEGFVLAGHNLIYDYGFLKQSALNQGISLEKEGIDTLKLARKLLPEVEKKTLDYLCAFLQIARVRNHRALDDAAATAELLAYLWEHFKETDADAFLAKPLQYKLKKQQPATLVQKRHLKELLEYHKIELDRELESLTRNEASRITDKIIFAYGRAGVSGQV